MIIETRFKAYSQVPKGNVFQLNAEHFIKTESGSYNLEYGNPLFTPESDEVEDLGPVNAYNTTFSDLDPGELFNGSWLKTSDGAVDLRTGETRVPLPMDSVQRSDAKLTVNVGVELV